MDHAWREADVSRRDLAERAGVGRNALRLAAGRPTADGDIGKREVGRVGDVECLGAERQLVFFGDRKIFKDREVHTAPVRSIALISAFGSRVSNALLLKCVQVDEVSQAPVGNGAGLTGYPVRTVRSGVGQIDQILTVQNRERLPGLPECDRVDLPAGFDLLAQTASGLAEGQFVVRAHRELVFEADIRVAPVVTSIVHHRADSGAADRGFVDVGEVAGEDVISVDRQTFRITPLEDELSRIVFAGAARAVEVDVSDVGQSRRTEIGGREGRTGRRRLVDVQ